jgi:hypothetical protein
VPSFHLAVARLFAHALPPPTGCLHRLGDAGEHREGFLIQLRPVTPGSTV